MSNFPPSSSSIAAAIQALVEAAGSPTVYQQVYLDEPNSFGGQSPTAVILPLQLMPSRFTAGAGRNKDKWIWEITTYVDRNQTSFDVAVQILYAALDALRITFQSHVQLNVPGTTVLAAEMDDQVIRFFYKPVESILYRCFTVHLAVFEEYNTTISS